MEKDKMKILEGQDVYVGLEDSKKTWRLCVRYNGIVVNETSMPADYNVLKSYFNNKLPGCHISVLYEAGFRGFELHDKLVADGWHCIVTPPHTVTEEKCSRIKNDSIDCRRLAKILETGDYKACHVPDRKVREDRQLSRTYEQVKRDIVKVCNRIRKTLEFHGLDESFKSGRWYEKDYRMARERISEMNVAVSLQLAFNALFTELEHLWAIKEQITKELYKMSRNEQYTSSVKLLFSVPGIGLLTAIRLVLEWGDISRFGRKEEFTKYIGLTPSEHSSGEAIRKSSITKQGNRSVRGWIIECAWVAIKYDPVLLNKFNRVMHASGSKKKAIVAVARTMAVRIRSILITGNPYMIGFTGVD